MMTQQRGIATAGHNIANQATPGYSRQQVSTRTAAPDPTGVGGGAEAKPTSRVFDRFLQRKVIQETPQSGVYATREDFLAKIEVIFNEMDGTGIRSVMNDFWDSWSQLSSQPESEASRAKVRDQGDILGSRFRGMYKQLKSIRNEANTQVASTVNTINNLANQLAQVNRQIFSVEAGGAIKANDARDERNRLIEELSQLVDVNAVEDKSGQVSVFIGRDWSLVQKGKSFLLDASLKGGELGMYSVEGISGKDFRRDLTDIFRSGTLSELLTVRNETTVDYMNQLNDLAFGVASKVNKFHATGTGLNSSTNMMKSAFGLNQEARSQPLPFIKDGIFQVHLVDDMNNFLETYEVEVQAGIDSVHDIVNRINQTVGNPELLNASVEEDGSVFIQSGMGKKFVFGDDQTDITQVLGFNSFFETLRGAEDIRLSDRILRDPNTISTGKDLIPGDNQIALEIAKLQMSPTMRNNTMTFDDFYNGILGDMGLRIQRNQTEKAQQDNLVGQFDQIRQSVSSVNLDEELANMIQYQKAYEASARFVNTVDKMMETVINM